MHSTIQVASFSPSCLHSTMLARREPIDVFSAIQRRLQKIDTMVEEMQMDLRTLHRYGGDGDDDAHGDGEDEDDVLDLDHIELCSFMEQIKSAVQLVRAALQEKVMRMTTNTRGGEDDDGGSDEAFPSGSGHLKSVLESLDPQLKQCALCLAVFPSGKAIKKRLLIHWWIGEGIVRSAAAGKACFQDLLSRGLLQPAMLRPHCHTAHYCRVHPLVRDLLVAAARSFSYFAFDRDGEPTDECLPGTTRRVTLCRTRGSSRHGGGGGEYVTVYNLSQRYVEMDEAWLGEQRGMGTLQLGRWQTSPEHHVEMVRPGGVLGAAAAAACRNLRYLSLRGISLVESLPESIGDLRDLVVLDLRACHNLETLPASMASLGKLEYLDASECYLLDQMPHGVCKLHRLQVLKGFVVASAAGGKKIPPCRLADLAALPLLRKLSVSTGRQLPVAPDDELPRLHGCAALESLSVRWGAAAAHAGGGGRMDLSLLPRLAKLDLRRVPAEELQEVVHPARGGGLRKLCVRGGRLRAFGDDVTWDVVETLRVRFLERLDCEWRQLRSTFGKLRFVDKRRCPKLSSWRCDAQGIWRREEDDGGDRN